MNAIKDNAQMPQHVLIEGGKVTLTTPGFGDKSAVTTKDDIREMTKETLKKDEDDDNESKTNEFEHSETNDTTYDALKMFTVMVVFIPPFGNLKLGRFCIDMCNKTMRAYPFYGQWPKMIQYYDELETTFMTKWNKYYYPFLDGIYQFEEDNAAIVPAKVNVEDILPQLECNEKNLSKIEIRIGEITRKVGNMRNRNDNSGNNTRSAQDWLQVKRQLQEVAEEFDAKLSKNDWMINEMMMMMMMMMMNKFEVFIYCCFCLSVVDFFFLIFFFFIGWITSVIGSSFVFAF